MLMKLFIQVLIILFRTLVVYNYLYMSFEQKNSYLPVHEYINHIIPSRVYKYFL